MSDITVPSYRVPRERSGPPWRMLAVAGGLLGAAALIGAVAWSLSQGGLGGGPRTIPVIEADSRPIKVRPEDPGGLVVANTDQLVLEPPSVRKAAERAQGTQVRLAPAPEAPALDLLRRQAAPPAPPPSDPGSPAPAPPAATPAVPAALPPPVATAPAPAERVAAAPAVQSPAAATGGRVTVQLGALPSEEAARGEWARLQRRVPELAGRQPQVIRLDRGEGQAPLWRLRIGGLPDAEAAKALCDSVRAQGGACMMVRGG